MGRATGADGITKAGPHPSAMAAAAGGGVDAETARPVDGGATPVGHGDRGPTREEGGGRGVVRERADKMPSHARREGLPPPEPRTT